jgi:hypothetical protein
MAYALPFDGRGAARLAPGTTEPQPIPSLARFVVESIETKPSQPRLAVAAVDAPGSTANVPDALYVTRGTGANWRKLAVPVPDRCTLDAAPVPLPSGRLLLGLIRAATACPKTASLLSSPLIR